MTQYLLFASSSIAQARSEADWAQHVLGHPVISNNVTKGLWGVIASTLGALGVIGDNVLAMPSSYLGSSESSALLTSTDPTVSAILASVAAQNPLPLST